MASLTGRTVANSYPTLIKVDTSIGIDSTLRTLQDGNATNTALQLSNSAVNINGTFQLNGVILSATASALNQLTSSDTTANVSGGFGILTSLSAVDIRGNVGGFAVKVSTVALEVSGIVSGVSAVFSGNVSASNITSIGTVVATNTAAVTSINTVVAGVSALTATNLAAVTSVNTVVAGVSALTATNLAAVTSINTVVATNTAAVTSVNTVVAGVSALTATNLAAVTSINTVVAGVSALTATNLAAVTSINTVVAGVSSTLATSIGNHLPLAGGTITGKAQFNKAAYADRTSLTDAVTVSIALTNSNNFHITLAGNRTLGNPTNGEINLGQTGSIFVVQDGTGSRTLAYGSSYEFPAGTVPTLSTSINAVDRLDYIVRTSTAIQMVHSGEYS
jgi:hypothetical protein